ncbi:5-(carboxyamino)imidazole ribonucleotide synthase [Lactobacillus terrae]|uniref:5-(carboxyamino)imidazole ribonucleotide synthase n=1 Tax=Lactobacillus terrae TaxID=2269374 RepID=UPI000C1B7BFB|nr:5-(carboxyamino)imidazole ribonucleotide synthase [Lactobacillus terrae]
MTNQSKVERTLNIKSGSTIGIVGGGQLGKMMAQSAKQMGYYVVILDPQKNCSAAQVSDQQIVAEYDDLESLIELSKVVDVLTYEFENVSAETISEIQKYTEVRQGITALSITQNRKLEKNKIKSLNLPVTNFQIVSNIEEFSKSLSEIGIPAILKTTNGGYDGKGQINIDTLDFSENKILELLENGECILEKMVDLKEEVSVIISRNINGDISIFPIINNEHKNNILNISYFYQDISKEIAEELTSIAKKLASELCLVGTMCVEFFISKNNQVYINEIAPRPHNSGHLTIEACNFSQFNTHIRGICNLPMPNISLKSNAVMINVLGQHYDAVKEAVFEKHMWHFHDYCKELPKKNRKMAHITVLTNENPVILKQEFKKNKIWDDSKNEG